MKRERWTKYDEELLRRRCLEGITMAEALELFPGRGAEALRIHAQKLRVPSPRNYHKTKKRNSIDYHRYNCPMLEGFLLQCDANEKKVSPKRRQQPPKVIVTSGADAPWQRASAVWLKCRGRCSLRRKQNVNTEKCKMIWIITPPQKKLSRRAYLLHKWRQRGIEIVTKERVIYVAYGTPIHPDWVELCRDFRFGIQSVIT